MPIIPHGEYDSAHPLHQNLHAAHGLANTGDGRILAGPALPDDHVTLSNVEANPHSLRQPTEYARHVHAQIHGAAEVPAAVAPMLDAPDAGNRLRGYYRTQAEDLYGSLTDAIGRPGAARRAASHNADDRRTGVLSFLGPVIHSNEFEPSAAWQGGLRGLITQRRAGLDELGRRFNSLAPAEQVRSFEMDFRRWGLPEASYHTFARADRSMQDYQYALIQRARTLPHLEQTPPFQAVSRIENLRSTEATPILRPSGLPTARAATPPFDPQSQIFEELFTLSEAERAPALERVVSLAREMRNTRDTLTQALEGLPPQSIRLILAQLQSSIR